jgi:hypothetical protein
MYATDGDTLGVSVASSGDVVWFEATPPAVGQPDERESGSTAVHLAAFERRSVAPHHVVTGPAWTYDWRAAPENKVGGPLHHSVQERGGLYLLNRIARKS